MLVKQRVKINIRIVVMLVLAATLLAASLSLRSYAVDVNNSPNTLKVSPVRTDTSIAAGSSGTVPVTVTNPTTSPITVKLVENDFIAGDEAGTPALILDADKYAPTHSLKRFMKPVGDITVPAKESKTIDVEIVVPSSARPGGYFGAVRFAPADTEGTAQVNLSTSVASLILLTVPGPVTEKLTLTDFTVKQGGKTSPFFQTPDDLEVSFRFKNSGDIHLAPFGKISVTQGDKVVYSTDFNQENPRQMTLPGYARRWSVPIEKVGSFGYYTVSATFTYGTKNQTIDVKTSFWVIPVWMMIAAAALLVVIIIAIILTIYAIRKRGQRRGLSGQRRRR